MHFAFLQKYFAKKSYLKINLIYILNIMEPINSILSTNNEQILSKKNYNYECKRCFYKTLLKSDMTRHLNRKMKCPRILESYKYNENDLEILSLTRGEISNSLKNEQIIDIPKNNKKEDIIEKIENDINNINKIDDLLIYISVHKIKKCIYCDAEYNRFYELQRHIKKSCKKINFNLKLENNNDVLFDEKNANTGEKFNHNSSIYDNNSQQNNSLNQNLNNLINATNMVHYNNQVNSNNVNNITINVYNNTNNNNIVVLPFDQNWDVSKIDDKQKLILFLEDKKYSKTMEQILQNDKNLNIIFDKDNDLGLIYKNDAEKFINMKTNDIIDKAMVKIYNHLISFYDEIKCKGYTLSELDSHKELIEKKFQDFNKDKDKNTKDLVKNILVDIFDKNKDKAVERFIQFSNEIINKVDNEVNIDDEKDQLNNKIEDNIGY